MFCFLFISIKCGETLVPGSRRFLHQLSPIKCLQACRNPPTRNRIFGKIDTDPLQTKMQRQVQVVGGRKNNKITVSLANLWFWERFNRHAAVSILPKIRFQRMRHPQTDRNKPHCKWKKNSANCIACHICKHWMGGFSICPTHTQWTLSYLTSLKRSFWSRVFEQKCLLISRT